MKKDIHPTYHSEAKVTCGCGASFTVGGTSKGYSLEICSECHPFYTGNQKLVDTAGRVERFKNRMAGAAKTPKAKKERKKKVQEEVKLEA